MKYIDAEKLKAEIEKRIKKNEALYPKDQGGYWNDDESCAYDQNKAYIDLLSYIASLQQEQPEVELEKFTEKVKTFQSRYKHPESISIKGAMAFMARMFYQYPNVAREWYDSLPKVTQD